jgi:hypothetical protein
MSLGCWVIRYGQNCFVGQRDRSGGLPLREGVSVSSYRVTGLLMVSIRLRK